MNYLEFSLYNTMFSEYRFICSIPIWMPFFFLANCPGYNLHYNAEYKWWKEMLWFVFYLIEKAFSLSPLGTMLVVGIGRCPLSGWSFILFLACWVHFFFFFGHDVLLEVVKCFFFAFEMIICFLLIILLIWCIL